MNKRSIIYVALLVLILGSFFTAEYILPDKTDWRESYSSYDKIPNGCFVLFESLPQFFPGQNIRRNNKSLYELLEKQNTDTLKNLFIISDNFNPDYSDLSAILNFIHSGNTVFISAVSYGKGISDTLKFHTSIYNPFNAARNGAPLQLYPKNLHKEKGYTMKSQFPAVWFSSLDTLKSKSLGTDNFNNINFFSEKIGKGQLYLSGQPHAFTNNSILYDDKDYASAIFSCLPNQAVIWDEYYKPDRYISGSPIRYILQNPSLKIAYYLLLLSILAYIIFESQRRQRIIPVIAPLSNSSMAFTRTIARLYYFRENHADLVQKKFNHFREFLSENYFLQTDLLNDEWVSKVAAKCAVSEELIGNIVYMYKLYGKGKPVSKQDLIYFSRAIEEFYKKAKKN